MADHSEGFLKLVESLRNSIKEITIEEVLKWKNERKDFHLVDVREDKEWAMNRIPGAIHIGKGVIERDVESLIPKKSDSIILYCGGGFRSIIAADSLQKMGYENVLSMSEGIRGWMSRSLKLDDD